VKRLLRRRSLVFRLLLLSVAAVTLPALLISVVHRSISSRTLLRSIEQQQIEVSERLAVEVNDQVQHARGLVALVAHSSFFSAGSRVDQYEALRSLLKEFPAFQEAMLVDPTGQELLKVGPQTGTARLMKRSEDLHAPYVGSPFFSANRAPTILLGEPLRSFANPHRSGAVLVKMSFMALGTLLGQAIVGPRGEAFIVDSKGTLLAHPDGKKVFTHANLAKHPAVQAWLAQPGSPTRLIRFLNDQGEGLLAVACPIPLLQSAVIIQQPRAEVLAPLQHMRRQFILWTALSLMVFLALTIAIGWRILTPMRQLQAAAREVGEGKRDVHLNIRTHDELEDLARTFEEMTRSLADLEKTRRDLISMIVHDLKMPLSTILPSLESLLVGDFGPLAKEQAYFIQMARRSSQEMLMLIQNLLDVAKMEEGKLTLHPELLAPLDWAKSVLANFEPLADGANKQLRLKWTDDLVPIEADVPLLSRVLGNLISNALRHTAPATGEIVVSLYRDGTKLAVEVRDNGEGIPAGEQERIFERYVQGEGVEARLRSGTGLGLTFCKMVVEAHGGHITVYSQPGEGSVFTFRLPMKASVVSPEEAATVSH
jgi:signal transduction histidine kinase